MKCVIPGANVKILARAIHALAKIGEEMYVQPQERALSFRSVGMSNSAYCDFTFRDNFFSYYNYGNLEEEDALKCKVAMRGAMGVFKTPGIMEKLVETCHIKLQPNATDLILILKYKNSVIKTFLLPILNCETIQASYNKDGSPNHLIVQPKVLADALQNFQQNLIEITLDVTEEKILMRNYVDDTSSAANATRTQLALAIGEFDTYKIGQNACVTFCVKEVRAILTFADFAMLPIHMLFEIAGRPIVLVLRNQSLEVNLVLSTVNPEPPDLSHTTIQERRPKRRPIAPKKTPKPSKPRKKTSNSSTSAGQTASTIHASVQNPDKNDEPSRNRGSKRHVEQSDESLVALVRSTSINNPQTSINEDEQSDASTSFGLNAKKTRSNLISETPSDMSTPPRVRIFSRETTQSMVAVSSRLRTNVEEGNNNSEDSPNDDFVPNSPPRQSSSKKARMMFRKCFQATFDPRMLPGHDQILAKDSDESD